MDTIKATQIAKSLGYGKVFVRTNQEICMTNKSGKVILTLNPDFTIKFSRWNMEDEAIMIKEAMEVSEQKVSVEISKPRVNKERRRWIKGSHVAPGHYVYSTGDYTTDVLSGYYEE